MGVWVFFFKTIYLSFLFYLVCTSFIPQRTIWRYSKTWKASCWQEGIMSWLLNVFSSRYFIISCVNFQCLKKGNREWQLRRTSLFDHIYIAFPLLLTALKSLSGGLYISNSSYLTLHYEVYTINWRHIEIMIWLIEIQFLRAETSFLSRFHTWFWLFYSSSVMMYIYLPLGLRRQNRNSACEQDSENLYIALIPSVQLNNQKCDSLNCCMLGTAKLFVVG